MFFLCGTSLSPARRFFGCVHLEALLNLGGGLIDIAALIDSIVKNIFELFGDIAEYLAALKAGIPPCKLPQFMFQSIGAYGFFEGKLKALLAYDDLKPEVFQNFRELGNSLLFLRDLSEAIQVSDQFDFNLLAPLLGLLPMSTSSDVFGGASFAPSEGGAVVDISSQHPSAVLSLVVSNTFKSLQASDVVLNRCVRSLTTAARLPAMVNRIARNYTDILSCEEQQSAAAVGGFSSFARQSTNGSQKVEGVGGGNLNVISRGTDRNLFKWVLQQIEEYFYQHNLTVDWSVTGGAVGSSNSSTNSFSMDVEAAKGFHRMWSALLFLFCMHEGTDSPDSEDSGMLSNQAEFGHGFVFAGTVIIHLLGQKDHFDLMDFTNYVVSVRSHDINTEQLVAANEAAAGFLSSGGVSNIAYTAPNSASVHVSTTSGMLGSGVTSLQRDTNNFVQAATANQKIQNEFFSFLSAQHVPRESYMQRPSNKVVFHPSAYE
jgi:hypothetical protein